MMSDPSLNSDLRVAVLGVGMMGAFHARALSSRIRGPGSRWSVMSSWRRPTCWPPRSGARVVDDPIAAINDAQVDAVLIATPSASHDEQVKACLRARKPVLCEKPLTTEV